MDEEAFCRRWQIGQSVPAMIFDCAGRRESDGLPIALINLSGRVGRKVWSVAIKTAPAPALTLVLSDRHPWAPAAALARCAILMAVGEAIDVYALSEDALKEVVTTLSGLSWWAAALGNPEPDARASATVLCGTTLSRHDIDRNDPAVAVSLAAIAEILTTIGVGGHA